MKQVYILQSKVKEHEQMREDYVKEVEYLEENYQKLNYQNINLANALAAKDDELLRLEIEINTLKHSNIEKPEPKLLTASLGAQIREIQRE